MKSASIMIVENNTDLRNMLRHAFEDRGYLTWTCPGPEIADSIFNAIQPNVVLLDLDLQGSDPLELIDAWKEVAPNTRVIVEIRIPDVRRIREAMDHGADAFIIKTQSLEPIFELLEKTVAPRFTHEIIPMLTAAELVNEVAA